MGGKTHEVAAKMDEYARGMVCASGSTLFEELGICYIGPMDGHNVEDLVTIFEKAKATPAPGLVLIHIVTEKGKGYPPAEAAPDRMHGETKEFFFLFFFDSINSCQLLECNLSNPFSRGCQI